jgi:hypothetical protein
MHSAVKGQNESASYVTLLNDWELHNPEHGL